MSQNNRSCSRGYLSNCNLTVTCADGSRRYIPCLAECSSSGIEGIEITSPVELVAQRTQDERNEHHRQGSQHPNNGAKGRNSLRTRQCNTTNQYRRSSSSSKKYVEGGESINSSSRGNRNSNDMSVTTEEHDDCNDNTYTEILDRFNRLKERMCSAPERGDKCFATSSCYILEEEKQVFRTCPDQEERPPSCSKQCRGTERINTTKVSSGVCNYIKETVIEQSNLTRYGVLTKRRHIIEKHGKGASTECEVSKPASAQSQVEEENIVDDGPKKPNRILPESAIDSGRSKRGSGSSANKSKRTSPKRGKRSRSSKVEEHSMSSRSDTSKVEDQSMAQSKQKIHSREINEDLDAETMPSLVNTTVDPSHFNQTPECLMSNEEQSSSQISGEEMPPKEKQKKLRSRSEDKTSSPRNSRDITDDLNQETMPSLVNTTVDRSSPSSRSPRQGPSSPEQQSSTQISRQEMPQTKKQRIPRSRKGDKASSSRNSKDITDDLNEETMPSLANTTVDRSSPSSRSPRQGPSSPEQQSSPEVSRQEMPQTKKQRIPRSRKGDKASSSRNSKDITDDLNEETMPSLVNTTVDRSSPSSRSPRQVPSSPEQQSSPEVSRQEMPQTENQKIPRSRKGDKASSSRNSRDITDDLNEETMPSLVNTTVDRSSPYSRSPRQVPSSPEQQGSPQVSRQEVLQTENQKFPRTRTGDKISSSRSSREISDDLNEESMPSLANTTGARSSASNRSQNQEMSKVQNQRSPKYSRKSMSSSENQSSPQLSRQRMPQAISKTQNQASSKPPQKVNSREVTDDLNEESMPSLANTTGGRSSPTNRSQRKIMSKEEKHNKSQETPSVPLRESADNLSQETMPTFIDTTVNSANQTHDPLECCPCGCQQCAATIATSLSLPANIHDPESVSLIVTEDEDGRKRVDYYLVGELLQNRSTAEATSGLGTSEQLVDITPSTNYEEQASSGYFNSNQNSSFDDEPPPLSSTAYPEKIEIDNQQEDSLLTPLTNHSSALGRTDPQEQLENVSAPTYESSTVNHSSSVENIENISAPSFHNTENNSSRRSHTSELIAEIIIPDEFNRELPDPSENVFDTEKSNLQRNDENISNITPPDFYTSSEGHLSQRGQTDKTDQGEIDELQRRISNEDIQNISEPSGMVSSRINERSDEIADGFRIEDETPPIDMEPSSSFHTSTNNKSLKQGDVESSVDNNVRRSSRRTQSSQPLRSIMVPLIYFQPQPACPGTCRCAEPPQYCQTPYPIQFGGCPVNFIPISTQYCESSEEGDENDICEVQIEEEEESEDTRSYPARTEKNGKKNRRSSSGEDFVVKQCCCNKSVSDASIQYSAHMVSPFQEQRRSHSAFSSRTLIASSVSNVPSMHSKHAQLLAEVTIEGLGYHQSVVMKDAIENEHCEFYILRKVETFIKDCRPSLDQRAKNISPIKQDSRSDQLNKVSISCECTCTNSSIIRELQTARDGFCSPSLGTLRIEQTSIAPSLCSNNNTIEDPVPVTTSRTKNAQLLAEVIFNGCNCCDIEEATENDHCETYNPSFDQSATNIFQTKNVSFSCQCTCSSSDLVQGHQEGEDEVCSASFSNEETSNSSPSCDTSPPHVSCSCTCTCPVTFQGHHKEQGEEYENSFSKRTNVSHMNRDSCSEQHSNKSIICECTCTNPEPNQGRHEGQDEDCILSDDQGAGKNSHKHRDSCTDQPSNKSILCDCTCTISIPDQEHQKGQDEDCIPSVDHLPGKSRDSCSEQHSNKSIICECTCTNPEPNQGRHEGQDEDCILSDDQGAGKNSHMHRDSCIEEQSKKSVACDCTCTISSPDQEHQKLQDEDCIPSVDHLPGKSRDSCTDQYSIKSIVCECTCTNPEPNQGQDEDCILSDDQGVGENLNMHRDSCTEEQSKKSVACDCTCTILSSDQGHQKAHDEDFIPSVDHVSSKSRDSCTNQYTNKSIVCDCTCTSANSVNGHQKDSSTCEPNEKCASKILKLIECCLQNQADDDCTCKGAECVDQNGSESEQNTKTVLQPIVIPIMIYQPRPPTCYECYNPQPAICSGYSCQCCDSRSCCVPNRPSYEIQYCDSQCATYSCPCQCYDQQSIRPWGMPTCPQEFFCPPPAPVFQTPFPCCTPQPYCCMQQCQPICLPPVTLQFANNCEDSSAHGKKRKDKRHKSKKDC